MKKRLFILFAAVWSIVFCSCRSSEILKANFETDVIDRPPSPDPAGAPTGDMIRYLPALEAQLRVQNSATVGEKALYFMNAPVTSTAHNSGVGFRGIATTLANTLWFTHTAKNLHPVGDVQIDVTDGYDNFMARMLIKANGEVFLARNIQDSYTDRIGVIGQQGHTIIFTTRPSELKYNVSIFQTGGATIIARDKPMVTENFGQFANPANPTISFRHTLTTDGNHQYIIESVIISRKEPN